MGELLRSTVRGARARLNTAIVVHRSLAWAAPAGLASGLLVALLRAVGMGAAGFPLWAALVLSGAAAGAARARGSRVDDAGAARWLDERLDDGELLSAALACLARGSTGRFDAGIVENAGDLAPKAAALRPSPRPIAKKAAIAFVACAMGAYGMFLAAPFSGSLARPRAEQASGAAAALAKRTEASAMAGGEGVPASVFAAALFPDDRRLATLAERALREGRLDDLRDILKAAELDYGSRIARARGEEERKSLTRDRERLREARGVLSRASRPDGTDDGGVQDNGGTRGGEAGNRVPYAGPYPNPGRGEGMSPGASGERRGGRESRARDRIPGLRGEEGDQGGPAGEGSGAAEGRGAGRGAGRGGSTYGEGEGSEGRWGAISPSAGTAKALLEPPEDASFFELVLPGRDPAAAVSTLVPDARRSAESAMSRAGVPLEYEEFVRSYFLALTRSR